MKPVEAHVAGHATHFLRRLDRASDRHVELALILYRDEELLREVLRRAAAPDGIERLAIALEPGTEGPFVVVTREGKFVTCLAAGMTTKGLFVVDFERFAHAASAIDRMRERLEHADRLGSEHAEARRLFRVVERAGSQLAREDFVALARWEPLLEKELVVAAVDAEKAFQKCLVRILGSRPGHLSPAERADQRAGYLNFWIWSHFAILSNVGDARRRVTELEAVQRKEVDVGLRTTLDGMRFGIVQPSARALWATGRQARTLLASVKALPTDAVVRRSQRTLGLAMIAHASEKARAEARKALEAAPPAATLVAFGEMETRWSQEVHEPLVRGLDEGSEAAAARFVRSARELVAANVEQLGELPISIGSPDDVPEDVAAALVLTSEASWMSNNGWLLQLVAAVPWLARADAADLFLPREWARAAEGEDRDEDYARFGNDMRVLFGQRAAPRVAEKKPGRNEPCSCGSGKKYKVCCGRAG